MDSTFAEQLVVEGLSDDVYAGWVYQIVSDSLEASADVLRVASLGVICEVLARKWMVAGHTDKDGHHPWTLSTGEVIAKIVDTWLHEWPDDVPSPGAIVWLANTDLGDSEARRVLR